MKNNIIYQKILNKIIAFDQITIFRHINPDGDAIYSQSAFAQFIKDNFKGKKVKICGFDIYDIFNNNEIVSDDFIEDSLAIVLDTADKERVDDKRFLKAKYIIKIDHHPPFDNYGNLNYVVDEAAATCELIAEMFLSNIFDNYKLNKKVCEYLYSGILTDTLNFKTTDSDDNTLMIAGMLVKKGKLLMSNISEREFDKSLDMFKTISKLRLYLKIKNNFGYILLNAKDLKEIGINYYDAKNNISEIGNIKELNIWAIFVYNNDENKYEVSLRSKRNFIINNIARKYGGGGHTQASGIKNLSLKKCKELIKELAILSIKK